MTIYENLSKIEPNRSVIPDNCLTFAEQSLYVAEFAESNFNEMFKQIGISELAAFEESGSVMIYEAEEVSGFKKKVLKVFSDIWAVIKAAYEKILAKFEARSKEARKNLANKVDSNIVARHFKGTIGKVHDYYDFSKFTSDAFAAANDVEAKIMKVSSDIKEAGYKDQYAYAKEKCDAIDETVVSKIFGVDKNTISEARKALLDKLEGKVIDVDLNWVKKNINDVKAVVINGKTKDDIKKAYQHEKSVIDKAMNKVKSDCKEGNISGYKPIINSLKNITTTFHSAMNVKMDACSKRFSEYTLILVKLSKLSAEDLHESAAPEITSETTQVDFIESAFNW